MRSASRRSEVAIKLRRLIPTILLVAVFFSAQFAGVAKADAEWSKVAFAGQHVSLISVNSDRPEQIMVVADNQLKFSLDGGILWRDAAFSGVVTAVAYDPVYPMHVYAGTNRGLYYSDNGGFTWSSFGNDETDQLSVVSLVVDRDYIIANLYRGAGSVYRIFRFTRDNVATQPAFPAAAPGPISLDKDTGTLYIGTRNDLYRSSDNGDSWQYVAGFGQIGSGLVRVNAHNGIIWETSVDGLYRSMDNGASWSKLTDRSNFYESRFTDTQWGGLVANSGNAFFGVSSYEAGSNDVVEYTTSGLVRFSIGDMVNEMAGGSGVLWAAGNTGLWRNNGLITSEASIKRPVIVIPGILGSWEWRGELLLDPITHAYDPLMNKLQAVGYVQGQTLFPFPYNWRNDNRDTANMLREKIAQVRAICGCPKVDILAHSMGGLVSRSYIQGDNYLGDVENLVEFGTPNAGSPESYPTWEAGLKISKDLRGFIVGKAFNLEAHEYGYPSITEYVRSKVPSVGQLLPIYSYLSGRNYPNGYPSNEFLESLDQPDQVSRLTQRAKLHIIGSDALATPSGFVVGPESTDYNWPHGQILDTFKAPGDGTVPLPSLQSLAIANYLPATDHGGLVDLGAPAAIEYLLGDATEQLNVQSLVNRYTMFYVKSPVRLKITDPTGRVISDIQNEIPGSFFTGSDSTVQFITIPDPLPGHYTVEVTGKGSGSYTVGASSFDEADPDTDKTVEANGITAQDKLGSFVFDSTSNQLTRSITEELQNEESPQDSPEDSPHSPEEIPPYPLDLTVPALAKSLIASPEASLPNVVEQLITDSTAFEPTFIAPIKLHSPKIEVPKVGVLAAIGPDQELALAFSGIIALVLSWLIKKRIS